MDKIIIQGGCRLRGEVVISGAKNSALPIMAASLLTEDETIIEGVPDLKDVHTMIKLLRSLGAKALYQGLGFEITANEFTNRFEEHGTTLRLWKKRIEFAGENRPQRAREREAAKALEEHDAPRRSRSW